MLQNARFTAFTVSELLRENKQGGKITPPTKLGLIPKMIEKSKTQDYLQRNGFLYLYQSGFSVKHSTDTCLS